MKTKSLKYWMVMQGPIIAIISFVGHGALAWLLPLYAFVLIPIAELFLPATTENMSEAEEEIALADPWYDWAVYLMVPIQYGLLAFYLYTICYTNNTVLELVGKTFSMGIACGILGINLGHELGHRIKPSERTMAKALLLTSMYMHFFIEHNRGHHKNVATPLDPATSRYGEIVYFFWFRSIINSWFSAWELEVKRVKKDNQAVFSLGNEMIRYILIQLSFCALIFALFGLKGLLGFLAVAFIGILLLETVNYIEHYGLTRKKSQGEAYERVLPVHSWNSNHVIGRLLLFELSRHSDHHYKASRKYQILRHFEDSPQMPTGYPGMIVLALVPPLWFYVMHRNIAKYTQMNPEAVKAWA
jgi:alkane 1-monooxygenase